MTNLFPPDEAESHRAATRQPVEHTAEHHDQTAVILVILHDYQKSC